MPPPVFRRFVRLFIQNRQKLGGWQKYSNKKENKAKYYSKGEELLEKADAGLSLGTVVKFPLGRGSWNTSEKAKGDRNIGTVFFGGSYAGWEFRELTTSEILIKYKAQCAGQKFLHPTWKCRANFMSEVDAKKILPIEQMLNPFFKHFEDATLMSTDITAASKAAKDEYPHLLSYDIPALSFAAGGTKIDKPKVLAEANKVNMNSATKIKTNGWPAERDTPDWYHSDFKDVAYLYTFGLFDHMVAKGNLK